jgi:hypothetical protein
MTELEEALVFLTENRRKLSEMIRRYPVVFECGDFSRVLQKESDIDDAVKTIRSKLPVVERVSKPLVATVG